MKRKVDTNFSGFKDKPLCLQMDQGLHRQGLVAQGAHYSVMSLVVGVVTAFFI